MLLFSFKMVIEECVVHFITTSLYRFELTTGNVVVFYTSGSDACDLLSETEGQCRRGLRERTKMAKSKNGDGTEWPDAGAKC